MQKSKKGELLDIPADYRLSAYDFELPDEYIAPQPAQYRDASRLLLIDRKKGTLSDKTFADLPELLPPECLLVLNNSKVVPARLYGKRPTGGRVEMLLLTPPPLMDVRPVGAHFEAQAEVLLRASKGPRNGEVLDFGEGLSVTLLSKGDFGKSEVLLRWQGDLGELLQGKGEMPLPPYLARPAEEGDKERYQTVYADEAKAGSAAAPTAGLHFTPELMERLKEKGHSFSSVTLYVGYGTFSPVREEDIRKHRMHREYIEISEETATAIGKARAEGRPVVAVGTTSVRTLEGAYAALGKCSAYRGWTELFLMPGSNFQLTDAMITNFHLPRSSLLIMVSALMGREAALKAYRHAVEKKYRFFSYGDAMLIL
jgi:S-adenosylmethionine:tRNA ribosyltransferase-isomerase